MSEDLDFIEQETTKKTGNPFPGLRPFKIEESHLFFGREGQSDEVLLKLSKNRFVGIIGPSGSGKSSFVYCGVLPILYGGFLTESGPNWEVIVARPGASPIDNLAEAFLEKTPEYIVADEEEKKIKKTIISTFLKSSSLGLVEAVKQTKRGADKNYLILIDQFEELFRFKKSSKTNSVNETLAFVTMLIEASNYADIPIHVAITMRSDFIGDCAQFPDLTKSINDSHYLIPQLTRDQKRKAITGPVAVGGADISSRLIQQLLNDLGDNPDQLPILQHSLMRTWNYWTQFESNDKPIDLKHYEAIGTMTEALSMHANEAFDELTEDQQHICQVLFKAITEKRGDNNGIRRPTRLVEVAAIANTSIEAVAQVIEQFREPGKSLVTPAYHIPLNEDTIIDISHESLMRIWVKLKNWVNEESEAVQMYLRLSDAAAMYQVGKAGLWRPPDLQLALNWKAKHKPTLIWGQRYNPAYERTMTFLDYSKREFETEQRIKEMQQKRRLKIARIVALIMASMLIVSIFFLVYALDQKSQAELQQNRAEVERKKAVQNEEKAIQKEKEAKESEKQAVANAKIAKEKEQEANEQTELANQQTQLANQQTALAQQESERANRERDNAEIEKVRADSAKIEAQRNETIAKTQKERADKLRYLAIAKSMAIKSTQIRKEQASLKGLLAIQAHDFNEKFDGDQHDHDIYSGLYYALKDFEDPSVAPLIGYKKSVKALTTSIKTGKIYSAGAEGKIISWTLIGDQRIADTLSTPRNGHNIRALAVDEESGILLAGGDFPEKGDSTSYIEMYNLNNNNNKTKVPGIKKEVWQMSYHKGNNTFYILDNGGLQLKSFQKESVQSALVFKGRINQFQLSTDGRNAYTVSNNGELARFPINGGKEEVLFRSNNKLLSLALDEDNNRIVVGDNTGIITMVAIDGTFKPRTLIGHISPINEIKFSNTGQFLATASSDKVVRVWNTKDLNIPPLELKDHEDWVWSIAFSPDDKQIMAGTQNRQIMVWPTEISSMSSKMCPYVKRQFTEEEWKTYVAEDIDQTSICKD